MATIPLGFYHPLLGMFCLGALSNFMRLQVVSKYNVIEEDICCCKTSCNFVVNQMHFGCNYPCSLFQMDMAMEQWQKEAKANLIVVAPSAPPDKIVR